MVNIAVQTAEMRADLVERIVSPLSVKMLTSFVQSVRRKGGDGMGLPARYTGIDFAEDVQYAARLAELYTMSPDIFELLAHSSKSMPPQVLLPEDLPSMSGFLWLPRPMTLVDIHGDSIPIRALLWHEQMLDDYDDHVVRGVIIWLFVEFGTRDDPATQGIPAKRLAEIRAMVPKLSMFHTMTVGYGLPTWDYDGEWIRSLPESKRGEYLRSMKHTHDLTVMEEPAKGGPQVFTGRTSSGEVVRVCPDVMAQFLSAFFHFLKSKVMSPDRVPLPRASAKWLRRLSLPTGPITVIRWRHRERGPETGNGWTLDYRYIRRAHWRLQWYGSGNHKYQRAILIMPTIVGPDDAPLRIRDVVNVVNR